MADQLAFALDTATTKTCCWCKLRKPLEAFAFRSVVTGERQDHFALKDRERGWLRSYCRPCARAYGREHYRANRPTYLGRTTERRRVNRGLNRVKVDAYLLVHPCVDCGESDTDVLDFDHRDATQKLDEISRMLGAHVWERVFEEIEKCDVRCGNCHRRRTAAQFGWVREELSVYLV